jgi:hypothetical protein
MVPQFNCGKLFTLGQYDRFGQVRLAKDCFEQTFTLTTAVIGGNDDVSTGILEEEVIYKDVRLRNTAKFC